MHLIVVNNIVQQAVVPDRHGKRFYKRGNNLEFIGLIYLSNASTSYWK